MNPLKFLAVAILLQRPASPRSTSLARLPYLSQGQPGPPPSGSPIFGGDHGDPIEEANDNQSH